VTNLFDLSKIDDSLIFNSDPLKITNVEKFGLLINQIENKIKKIDSSDKKFTNPKYLNVQKVSKIIKILIVHKDFKSYIDFNKNDLKILKMILALKFHLYNKLKFIINLHFTGKNPPKSLPSHPIPTLKFFESNNIDPKKTFVLFGDEFKWKDCPTFVNFHKKHFSRFGFSCHIQKFEFWKMILKEKIESIVINEISHKYRDFIFNIIDGKCNKIPILFVFRSRNNFRWCQALLNKFHPQHFDIKNSEWFFLERKTNKSVIKQVYSSTEQFLQR
jgi:hypothetical protein